MLQGPTALRVGLTAPRALTVGCRCSALTSALLLLLLFLVAEALQGRELIRRVLAGMLDAGRRRDRVVGVLAEQEFRLDLTRDGRFGADPPGWTDHDHEQSRGGRAHDDPDYELHHAWDGTEMA